MTERSKAWLTLEQLTPHQPELRRKSRVPEQLLVCWEVQGVDLHQVPLCRSLEAAQNRDWLPH